MNTPSLPYLPVNACRNGRFCPTPDYAAHMPQATFFPEFPPARLVCQNTKMPLRTLDNLLK